MIQSVWKNLTGLRQLNTSGVTLNEPQTHPNTNDLYIHYMDKVLHTPSLEEKKALPNRANKDEHNSCT